ncbi:[protein-PII] uridylyltransferase [Planctobacterium marinum]|uniref:[protein-PII] uridylyltransferase n=1 Tax=Planctobacterium marinum TaxID=1631968 RepID=UPI001E4E5E3F|nr:[protein-PII] uridylyltransferase [Planctobacterium marinum]MCC2606059.1 [protein-PII] uridylyltransferase [Planctobacterium marinum]
MAFQSLLSQVRLITSPGNTQAFKECISNSYEWLEKEFETTDVNTLVTGRAAFVDTVLSHIWRLLDLQDVPQLALVAVGGYGRGHLQPHSDVDLLILSHKALDKTIQEKVTQFITILWDIGLDIGQSVRTVKETIKLAKEDVTIATNLIESRVLAGSKTVFEDLHDKMQSRAFWPSKLFYTAKYDEQQIRHAKFNGTSYNLEPNIKENPGCLRDIQCIGWVAKKHFSVLKGKDLVDYGYFTREELDELTECRTQLWRIRFVLHIIAGRSENRLLFDYQPEVARRLGYGDDGKASVEKMMKAFFRVVRRVRELNEMLLGHFRHEMLREKLKVTADISADFNVLGGLIHAKHDKVFDSPVKIMDFFHIISDYSDITGLHATTLRLLRNARRVYQEQDIFLCQYPECRTVFLELVKKPEFFELAWDLMHKHGIMQSYISQWNHIVGMMQFDLFHAYTVDEHTHRLIKNLARYNRKENDHEFPRCGRIMRNADKPELLFLAGIFHDIAKGRNGDHSKLGAQDVEQFCQLHDIPEKDKNLIKWLVEHHLLMSVVAQRRDIYDPEVIQEFAATVRTQEHLEHLYALTLADIRATNSNLWNEWKSSLLRELFIMTQKALENGLENKVDLQSREDEHKASAMKSLLEDYEESAVLKAWENFPPDYFARFKPEQIAWHTHIVLHNQYNEQYPLVVAVTDGTAKSGTELMLYGADRPRLFAQVASVLDSRNCSIQDAQLMTTKDGYIFDSFIILEQDGKRISSPSRLKSLQDAIVTQLQKPGVEHVNKRRIPRQLKQLAVPTKVRFFGNQDDVTMMELEALDAPGLLAKLGHIFVEQDLSLHHAKITTIGERAEDLFILSNGEGKCLSNEQQVELKRKVTERLSDNH